MLPLVIYEDSVRLFNYYFDGSVRQGMSYRSKLYKLIRACQHGNRLHLYGVGCSLANHGIETVITASEQEYKVWVEVSAEVNLDSIAQP